jgi:hypothetical protein
VRAAGIALVIIMALALQTSLARFLTASDINAPNNLSLPVELALDARLNLARQLHVVQNVEQRLLIELHGRSAP